MGSTPLGLCEKIRDYFPAFRAGLFIIIPFRDVERQPSIVAED